MPRDEASAQKQDPVEQLSSRRWRIANLYQVKDKDGYVKPFRPNDAQAEFISRFHGRDVILKARQLGFTTLAAILFLDACIFQKDQAALIIAHRQDDAVAIFRNKIKWVWERFVEDWPQIVEGLGLALEADSASELRFSNGSSIKVSVSGRSGTYQWLLVTEFGKMCAQFPKRADEVVSGAFNAVPTGGVIIIESTAEGQEGHFYAMSRKAQAITPGRRWPIGEDEAQEGQPKETRDLALQDFRFHFFPWWQDPGYVAHAPSVIIPDHMSDYFDKLERMLNIALTDEQRAWYAKKDEEQGGLMKREYPSHPAEAFSAALQGCYLEMQIEAATVHKRIGPFPLLPGVPVNTFWDIGRDMTSIWLHQRDGERNRFVGYYERSGEHISHFSAWLKNWAQENQASFDRHYGPHDVSREDAFLEHGRLAEARKSGIDFVWTRRVATKMEGVEAVRGIFRSCVIDQRACAIGISRLKHYRKQWDDRLQVFKDTHVHDINSHGFDAFQTFAIGYEPPKPKRPRRRKYTGGLV